MRDIPAHIAIVTGAARGIGFAIAARLARAGAATVLADLDEQGAAAASAELNRAGGLSLREYEVLVRLQEAEGHRLRFLELSKVLLVSQSGVSTSLKPV